MTKFIERLRQIVEARRFERFITALIIVNAITLGLETSQTAMARFGPALEALDRAILAVFVIELLMRILVHGRAFWRDPWSLFDFSVVAVALVPATGNLSVLRALRVIRALRLITAFPSMRRVVGGLIKAIPGMGSVVALLLLIFYVASVMATRMFGAAFPDWFGTIGLSAFTLFQIMTLESWADGKVRPVMEVFPWAWAFFVPFILVTSFAVLNLFIGIVVDAMQREAAAAREAVHEEAEEAVETVEGDIDRLAAEVRALRAELQLFFAHAGTQPPGNGKERTPARPLRSRRTKAGRG